MTKHPNVVKLDASFVPQWTHKTTLAMEGYEGLQESIGAKEFLTDGVLKNYYVEAQDDTKPGLIRAMRVASVLAKHLRLMGNPLILSPISGALHEQKVKYMEREIEPVNPVMEAKGAGYIVIPDFMLDKFDPAEVWTQRETRDFGIYLINHIHNGGGLVLAGRSLHQVPHLTAFGYDLEQIIRTQFVVQPVK